MINIFILGLSTYVFFSIWFALYLLCSFVLKCIIVSLTTFMLCLHSGCSLDEFVYICWWAKKSECGLERMTCSCVLAHMKGKEKEWIVLLFFNVHYNCAWSTLECEDCLFVKMCKVSGGARWYWAWSWCFHVYGKGDNRLLMCIINYT